jgi:hypothetical protein
MAPMMETKSIPAVFENPGPDTKRAFAGTRPPGREEEVQKTPLYGVLVCCRDCI